MFDIDRTSIHTGHTGHTGLHRLGVDDGGATVRDNINRFSLTSVDILTVGLQVEDDVSRVKVTTRGLCRAGVGTTSAFRTGVHVEDLFPREVLD